MAKELPYFKFYLNDWLTGNITIQDMATQGVFVNVCVLFWSRDCDLTYQNCIERFKKKDRKLIENLVKIGIIKIENEKIRILFLEKQLENQNILSKTNQKNVKKRYSTPANPTNFSTTEDRPVYNIDEIRGEEIKGEERKEDDIIPKKIIRIGNELFEKSCSEIFLSEYKGLLETMMMTTLRGMDKNELLARMDDKYPMYEFRDRNHFQNALRSIGEEMKGGYKKTVNLEDEINKKHNKVA